MTGTSSIKHFYTQEKDQRSTTNGVEGLKVTQRIFSDDRDQIKLVGNNHHTTSYPKQHELLMILTLHQIL